MVFLPLPPNLHAYLSLKQIFLDFALISSLLNSWNNHTRSSHITITHSYHLFIFCSSCNWQFSLSLLADPFDNKLRTLCPLVQIFYKNKDYVLYKHSTIIINQEIWHFYSTMTSYIIPIQILSTAPTMSFIGVSPPCSESYNTFRCVVTLVSFNLGQFFVISLSFLILTF